MVEALHGFQRSSSLRLSSCLACFWAWGLTPGGCMASMTLLFSRPTSTVWPSGLRRWLQAPVRKGVGSNPTAVISALILFCTSPILQLSPLPKHTAPAKARKQANAGARKLRSESPNNLQGDVVGTQSHILALARCRDPGSNRGPSDLRSDALPTELRRQM